MRAVIQKVTQASVSIDKKEISSINQGLLILLGIEANDNEEDISWLTKKIAQLRIFSSESKNIDKSILDINGDAIVVSQFTLYASTKKGNRPSFLKSAKPEIAKPLYKDFITKLETQLNKKVGSGIFGADMQIALVNDGPVTISIDTKNRE